MADTDSPAPPPSGEGKPPEGDLSGAFRHVPVSARVPERVAKGVFATALIAMEGNTEFVLDFVQALTRPPQIVARVVMSPAAMHLLINALGENLNRYQQTFGPLPAMPKSAMPPPIMSKEELYEHFRLPDEQLSGAYANTVLIGHNPAEFFLDFITTFYPTAAVSTRVYLSAAQAPKVHEIITRSMQQHVRRLRGQSTPPSAPAVPPEPPDQSPPPPPTAN